MTGGTETRALIRWKECAEITAGMAKSDTAGARGPLTGGEAGPGGVAQTWWVGLKGIKGVSPEKSRGYNAASKCHWEGGCLFRGDSEDRVRTEGQWCREGEKAQLQQPERWLGEIVSSPSLATFQEAGTRWRGLSPGGRAEPSPRSSQAGCRGGGHGGCHWLALTLHVIQVCGAQHLGLRLVGGRLLLWATQAAQGTAWA